MESKAKKLLNNTCKNYLNQIEIMTLPEMEEASKTTKLLHRWFGWLGKCYILAGVPQVLVVPCKKNDYTPT